MIRFRIQNARKILHDFFFAPKANCLGCSSALGAVKGFLCPDCYRSLSPLYTTFAGRKYICNLCGREIEGLRCRCGGRRNKAYTAYSAYHFELPVSTLVKAFKYRHVKALSPWMANEMITALKGEREFDVITFVPMHPIRKIKRGFNQAEILSKHISDSLNIPVKALLKRKRFTKRQATLSAAVKRRENLKNVFFLKETDVKDARILLVDDVRTTGTTLISCADVLMKSGARSVTCVTLASSRLK